MFFKGKFYLQRNRICYGECSTHDPNARIHGAWQFFSNTGIGIILEDSSWKRTSEN